MDFILFVASIAGVLTLGIVLGVIFAEVLRKDAKDAADEFVKAKSAILADYEKLKNGATGLVARVEAIEKFAKGQ